ncbi:MAG: nitrite reductase small subunit NirD [Rhodocyclales bacterium]|nr:nitrite reductase small subunit NirD [Rhodocyclales bacterium]
MSTWHKVCRLEEIPLRGSRVIPHESVSIAVFRTADDAVFALEDSCPHKAGPLSQGIVHGHRIACPLHGWNLELSSGIACAPDEGSTKTYEVRVDHGVVLIAL